MGNYYEGSLSFIIKKDIPDEELNNLCMLAVPLRDRPNDKEMFSSNIKVSKWFSHKEWNGLGYGLKKLYRNTNLQNGCEEFIELGMEEYLETCVELEDMPDAAIDFHLAAYYFDVNLCLKGYWDSYIAIGEAIRDYLAEFCDTSFYNMSNGGYLGHIEDEDGSYRKDFFIDEDTFQEQQSEKRFLCGGCELYSTDCFCKHWNMCYRAYKLGQKRA